MMMIMIIIIIIIVIIIIIIIIIGKSSRVLNALEHLESLLTLQKKKKTNVKAGNNY